MKFKSLIFIGSCLISTSVWSWDMKRIVANSIDEGIYQRNAVEREARNISQQQIELRQSEQNFIVILRNKIESLEKQVEKQNEVIATYEELVVALKSELEKEKINGK